MSVLDGKRIVLVQLYEEAERKEGLITMAMKVGAKTTRSQEMIAENDVWVG